MHIPISAEEGLTIRVPDAYPTIQEAINGAKPGDTVVVFAGMYYEHVVVNKSISLVGENCGTTIIDGDGVGNVVSINVANVSISGFTIRNGGNGLLLENSDNCDVSDNVITANLELAGIFLNFSSGNNIYNNHILNNTVFFAGLYLNFSSGNNIYNNHILNNTVFFAGLYLNFSSGNNIYNNHILNHGSGPPSLRMGCGVCLFESDNNTITENNMSNNYIDGIAIAYSSMNTVSHNQLVNNTNGVSLIYSTNNILGRNNVTLNRWGICIDGAGRNLVHDNRVSHNKVGIEIYTSAKNIITGNLISHSTKRGIEVRDVSPNNVFTHNILKENALGIYIHFSNDSAFYKNNFINNSIHASLDGYPDVNVWDNGAEGNYWSGFSGDDSNGDDIIDVPYILDVRNQDNYPLTEPWRETRTFPIIWDEMPYNVTTHCNSTVGSLHFNQPSKYIGFNITGPADSIAICNVTIPLTLMWSYFSVLIDDVPQPYAICQNQTHTSIYFTIPMKSTMQVKILATKVIPESPEAALLTLFIIATLISVILLKRIQPTQKQLCQKF